MIKKMFAGLALAIASAAVMLPAPAQAEVYVREESSPNDCSRDEPPYYGADSGRFIGCRVSGPRSRSSGREERVSDPRETECRAFVASAYDSPATTGIRNGAIMGVGGAASNRQFGYVNHGEGDRAAAITGLAYGIISGLQQRDTRHAAYEYCMQYGPPSRYDSEYNGPPPPH